MTASIAAAVHTGEPVVPQADRETDARTPAPAARQASRAQGRGLLRLARRVWPDVEWDALGTTPHLAVAAGVVGAASGLKPDQTALSVVYTTMTGSATAAQRLLALDPGDVAALTFELSPLCEHDRRRGGQGAGRPVRSAARCAGPAAQPTRATPVRLLKGKTMPPHFIDGATARPLRRPKRHREPGEPLRIGVGGPVGSGKTALVAALCRQLRDELSLAVLTNDIYTTEDADFLRRHAVLPDERIAAVQTGGCPHTAIRDDITANLDAIDDLVAGNDRLDLILVESGGDNLTATFSSGLVDVQIFVIDVAGGDKVPRKGGPGVTYSDLLVVNKTDLAPLVGADLEVMRRDAATVRGDRPTVLISLTEDPGRDAGAGVGARTTAGVRCSAIRRPHRRVPRPAAAHRMRGRTRRRAAPNRDTVHLVSAAATPLGGDAINIRVVVEAGARLRVRTAAATVTLPGRDNSGVACILDARGGR